MDHWDWAFYTASHLLSKAALSTRLTILGSFIHITYHIRYKSNVVNHNGPLSLGNCTKPQACYDPQGGWGELRIHYGASTWNSCEKLGNSHILHGNPLEFYGNLKKFMGLPKTTKEYQVHAL